jgi:hypothetical protein
MSDSDNREKTARGIATVMDIVQAEMKCGWQSTDPLNDNAIDGLIFDRRHGVDTGTIVFTQVKCGDGYRRDFKKRPSFIGINVGKKYIAKHRPRWNALQGPAILVYVDFATKKAWWANVKADTSYTAENKSVILVPKDQRFGPHSIGHLRALRGFVDLDRALHKITLDQRNIILPQFSQTLKSVARRFYVEWGRNISRQSNPGLGRVIVSRVGWRHLTRRGRGLGNITQSLMLLGAAERIIRENTSAHQLNRPTVSKAGNETKIREFLSLRSRVVFPTRQEGVVQVILIRQQVVSSVGAVTSQTWFYSVHEPRRAKIYGIE